MTRIKICGITSVADAHAAVAAGADALGLVFAESPRRLSPEAAREIVSTLPPFIAKVGVFRDMPMEDIRTAVAAVGLDVIQLHGSESNEYCTALDRPVIRRLRMRESDSLSDLQQRMRGATASAWLLDPGAGDGKTFEWQRAVGLHGTLIVAGGLTPENVTEAVRLLRPYAVDVSSGVESSPGRKDAAKISRFVHAVRMEDARNHAR